MQNLLNLICEAPVDISSCEVLIEETKTGEKLYKIKGPFLQAEIKNGNGRMYPMNIMEPAVELYVKHKIKCNRALGELSHPPSAEVNLERAAIKITELKQSDNNFIGIAEVLSDKLPCAKVVKGLIDSGVRFGVSSRGVGSLKESDESKIVTRYKLVAEDIIYEPSGPDCFVDGIVESKQYILDESTGQILEWNSKAFDFLEMGLASLPKKDRTTIDKVILDKCFEFINSIRNNI